MEVRTLANFYRISAAVFFNGLRIEIDTQARFLRNIHIPIDHGNVCVVVRWRRGDSLTQYSKIRAFGIAARK